MDIEQVTSYKFNGKEYRNLAAIKTDIENRIGEIIDCDVTLTPKQKLNMLKAIVTNKAKLHSLLDVSFTIEDGKFGIYQTKNILDL